MKKQFLVVLALSMMAFIGYGYYDTAIGDYSVVVENPGAVSGASAAQLYYPSGISSAVGATTMSAGYTQALGDVDWLSRAVAAKGYVVIGLTPSNNWGMVSGWKAMHKGGIAKLQQLNSSHNVLRGKIDLAKLQTCGHSKGGGGSLWASSELRSSLRTTVAMAPYREEFSNSVLGAITAATFIQAGGADTLANNSMTRGEYGGLGNISKMYAEYSGYDHLAWTTTHADRAGRISGDIIAWMKYYMDGDTSYAGTLSNKSGTQNYDWVNLGAPQSTNTGSNEGDTGSTGDTGNTDNGYTGGCDQWEWAPNNSGCDQWGQNPGTTPTTTPTPTSQPVDPVDIDDGYHQQRMQFINMSDGNYLTAETGVAGAAVIAESESSLRAQWVIHKTGGDYYQIINAYSGKALAPYGGTAVSGADLVAASNSSGSAQYWKLVAVQNDANARGLFYTIVNYANSGLAVTLQNGSYILSSNTRAAGQKFLFNAYGAEGFAGYSSSTNGSKTASITGGVLGSVVSVSSVSQLQSYAKGVAPYIIVIDGNISASSITKVEVGQNKTFIGSYRNNALNNIHFRCISNSGNIIFKNITFNHSSNLNANDDIQVYISSGKKFWIDHCTFTGHSSTKSGDVDKFLYVGANNPPNSSDPADYVSVTGCKFGGHKYGLILGYPQDNATARQFTGNPQMTIANCYFHSTITRAPGLMRYGYFHSYNNYVYDFSTAYTVYTSSNVYSENNYFDKGSHTGYIFDSSYAGKFTDSGSVLTNVNMNYTKTSWRPSSNYEYNVRAATQVPAWCRNYAGSQSSTIVYSVDDFDNDSNGPIIGNNTDDNSDDQTGNVTNGTYSFVAVHSGKALDTWEWGTTDGTNIVQYDYWGGEAQQFHVSGDAAWKEIAPVISMAQRFDVANGATYSGANIQTWSSNGYDAQKFKFESAGSGAYRIINKGSGMCLTIQNASMENGANVVQSTCVSGANNQMFKMEAH